MDRLFRDVREFDASVFVTGSIGLEVDIFYIRAIKSIPGTRNDAVGNQFDSLEGASSGTDVSGVDGFIAPDGDLRAFFVFLVGFDLA